MRIVHPEFFTDTMTWEVAGIKAPTLRELQGKLKGVKLKGYYPEGYKGKLEDVSKEMMRKTWTPSTDLEAYKKPRKSAIATAATTTAISPTPAISHTPAAVREDARDYKAGVKVFSAAYMNAKNPGAYSRKRPVQRFDEVNWTAGAVEQLTRWIKDGQTPAWIGRQMHCSRNAIIGKCYRLGLQLGTRGRPPKGTLPTDSEEPNDRQDLLEKPLEA